MVTRNQHSRTNDHEGSQPLSSLVLETTITPRYPSLPTYPAGMLVADVLTDLYARLAAVTIPQRHVTADAVIMRVAAYPNIIPLAANAVIGVPSGDSYWYTFSQNATIKKVRTGTFTADAVVA